MVVVMSEKVNKRLKLLPRKFHKVGMVWGTEGESVSIDHARPRRNDESMPRRSFHQRDRVDAQAGLEKDFQMIQTNDRTRRFPKTCGEAFLNRSSA